MCQFTIGQASVRQESLFFDAQAPFADRTDRFSIATTPEISALLDAGAVVAVGVSGGKDGCSAALRLEEYLNAMGHHGPRLLIHSDLGRVE